MVLPDISSKLIVLMEEIVKFVTSRFEGMKLPLNTALFPFAVNTTVSPELNITVNVEPATNCLFTVSVIFISCPSI